MCGIAGHAGPNPNLDAHAALEALAHRGPDDSGVFHADGPGWSSVIVHTRLAINDLSNAGRQPLFNEDETLALVLNGEIYNYPELRRECETRGHTFRSHCDAEVVLHLWEDHGIEALHRLNGMFALAIVDQRDGTVVLARDPLGVKPLLWSQKGDSLWFASELRALRAAGAPVGGPDVVALAQFLTFLWVPDPRTPMMGATSVEPGEVLVWKRGELKREIYCDIVQEATELPRIDANVVADELPDRLRTAVQRQLLADVPVALMASGGIDSSLLWWAARDSLTAAFTIEWPRERGAEGLSEDAEAVRTLEHDFGTPVTYLRGDDVDVLALPRSGDLFADPAVDLCRLIARRAREAHVPVLLSGQGADELFGGYRRHILGPRAARFRLGRAGRGVAAIARNTAPGSLPVEYLARLASAASQRDAFSSYMVLCSYSDAGDRASVLGCTEREVDDEVVWSRHREVFERTPRSWSLLQRFRAIDVAVYLPGLGLAYADRAGMEHGVEIRVPWLDLELVRWAIRIPDDALIRGMRGKLGPRDLASRVLPDSVVSRPKRGFAAPARVLHQGPARTAGRGFRQSRYFATASDILDRWLIADGVH